MSEEALAVDSTEHTVSPQAGTVYSWFSVPSDGGTPDDFPLVATCAGCLKPIVCRRRGAPWERRAAGEEITEPTDRDF